MTRLFMILLDGVVLATCASGLLVTAAAQSLPIVSHDLYHDVSAPVREYASSLLIGAFCASYAATIGGRLRDRVTV